MSPSIPNRAGVAVIALVMAIHAGLVAWGAYRHSPALDEVGHMAAGLSHWRMGRFDLYNVNPPLVRLVATLPVTFANPRVDWGRSTNDVRGGRAEFAAGEDFVAANGEASLRYFTLARWACIPFSLLGALVCYRWACDRDGRAAGLLSLTLWCTCPNILANAQMITPDTAAAALGLAASYLFWRWLRVPGWRLAAACGAALGLALLAKSTWLVLGIVWPTLATLRFALGRAFPSWRTPAVRMGQVGLMFALACYLINLAYVFEDSGRPLGTFEFISDALSGRIRPGEAHAGVGNRYRGGLLGPLPVPLPANYVYGIDSQRWDFELGGFSYLRGRWRLGGWWYYYVYSFIVKTPLGTLVLVALAALARPSRPILAGGTPSPGGAWIDRLALGLPPAVVVVLVSSQTGFNHHARYALPALPFLYVWMGRAAAPAAWLLGRGLRAASAMALSWSVLSSLGVSPHSHAYFNELAGGPRGGRHHLVDSNLEWGQDLIVLKEWIALHPDVHPLNLAYFGGLDPRNLGITYQLPVGSTEAGGNPPGGGRRGGGDEWFAISATLLQGYPFNVPDGRGGRKMLPIGYYREFRRYRPVAICGHAIHIYRLSAAEVRRLRSRLDPLPG